MLGSQPRASCFAIDGSHRITAFNPAAELIFGYRARGAIGQKVTIVMPPPYRDEHEHYIGRYQRGGPAKAIGKIRVVRAQRRSGETFPIELSVCDVGPAGGPGRYWAFIRDISDKVRLQERLVERERLAAIGATAAMFAREVSNPLNGMSMNTQFSLRLLGRGATPEEISRCLTRTLDEIRRLTPRTSAQAGPHLRSTRRLLRD